MSMSFDDAIGTLQAMFPDWDKDTLTMVLTSNNYHVERTIESIFIMQGDGSANDTPVPAASNNPSQRTQDLLFGDDEPQQVSRAAPAPKRKHRRNSDPRYRGIKCDLPDNFLRPPTWEGSNHIIADEELALMLQNELFQREVRQLMGEDFLREGDMGGGRRNDPRYGGGGGGAGASRGQGQNIGRMTAHGQGPDARRQQEDPADLGIVKALSSMGSAAKRNLSVLAERFSKEGTASGAGGSAGTSKEFKPLVDSGGNSNVEDDEDGDEVISFESNRGRQHIMTADSPRESQNPLLNSSGAYRTNNVGFNSGGSNKKGN